MIALQNRIFWKKYVGIKHSIYKKNKIDDTVYKIEKLRNINKQNILMSLSYPNNFNVGYYTRFVFCDSGNKTNLSDRK